MHAVQCVAKGELSERIPSILQLGTGADESRYCQRCESSNATTQGPTEACKTSCHNAKGNRRTASCCWHTLHHAEYSEYSNKSCSTTQTANLFFVVFYSYEQESPCSDFSLKSCDGKSVAQDIGAVSEIVDHVDVAECSGNTRYWVRFGDIQGRCIGQASR